MRKMKKFLALFLALMMLVTVLAACGGTGDTGTTPPDDGGDTTTPPDDGGDTTTPPADGGDTGTTPPEGGDDGTTPPDGGDTSGATLPEISEFDPNASYIYKDTMSSIPANWNPHTYQSTDESVPLDYTSDGLYAMLYNDESHPVEGLEPYEGYVIVPAMAAEMPVDVTESVKAEHPEFNIPADATENYAWSVKLRDDLKWDDGTPITAQDFVDSLERVLRPTLLNYRGSDYSTGSYVLVNTAEYYQSDRYALDEFVSAALGDDEYVAPADFVTSEEGVLQANGKDIVVDLSSGGNWGSDSLNTYYESFSANVATAQGYVDEANEAGDAETAAKYEGLRDQYAYAAGLIETLKANVMPLPNDNWVKITPELLPVVQNIIAFLHGYMSVEDYAADSGDYAYQEFEELAFLGKVGNHCDFSNVGLYVSGDNELTFVFKNPLEGFYLLTYGLNVPLVKIDLYDSLLKETTTAAGTVWTNTYNSNLQTCASYGPYKLSDYQTDKSMHFVKNDNWYGWTEDNFTYIDPEDGQRYRIYETTEIDIQYVQESATRKLMFLAGQTMGYGLQAEDFDQYRNSEYCFATPGQAVFGLVLNGYLEQLKAREAASDFDQNTTDLETMSVLNFRKALAVSINRDQFAAEVSPARSGGYGLLGTIYVYDPETGALYRDTDQAKQALCTFYSVDVADYGGDLDAAVDAITGYDPVAAKELFTQAFQDALDAGYITDNDGDGKSDQTVTMQYAISTDSDLMTKTIEYLNQSIGDCAAGTPFEGKILITKSAPLGDPGWSDAIRGGTADCVLAGWSGATMDPFSFADTWTNDESAYWAAWFDATKVDFTFNVDGKDVTMKLRDWALCLNGETKTVDGVDYNFGYGQVDVSTRLDLLAAIEVEILGTYNTLPMLADGGMSLLSQQVYYVVDEYNPMMGRGGMTYMKYNYDEAEWNQYVADQGGTLQY